MTYVGTSAFAGTANEMHFVNRSSGCSLEIDLNADKVADGFFDAEGRSRNGSGFGFVALTGTMQNKPCDPFDRRASARKCDSSRPDMIELGAACPW